MEAYLSVPRERGVSESGGHLLQPDGLLCGFWLPSCLCAV
jgi:hypothetical protein